jgi:agmatine deiminase
MKPERIEDSAPLVVPAEWAPQKAIWTAFPSHADLWLENLAPARKEVGTMIMALAGAGPVNVLVMGEEAEAAAKAALTSPKVRIVPAQFGDIWLRDTGPIFIRRDGRKVAATFKFNGWGGKYELEHDDAVGAFIAEKSGVPVETHDFILEGGALEHDGAGAIITTRECMLNPNRNPGITETEVEKLLRKAFGATSIIWLDDGLLNDHTDGHVDNIARFAAPGHVICQMPSGDDDPNAERLEAIARQLSGTGMHVTRIPGPGLVMDEDGEPVAASHMNYVIYNDVIVLPVYNREYGKEAAAELHKVFPQHRVLSVPARHVLTGGGSFHCITQQEF